MMRSSRWYLSGFAMALVATGLLAGCSSVPQSVINVPGTYTFGKQTILGPSGPFLGPPGGHVIVCVDTAGPLHVDASFDAGMSLSFDGVAQYGTGYSWTTTTVGPGCGDLGAGDQLRHGDAPEPDRDGDQGVTLASPALGSRAEGIRDRRRVRVP